MASGLQRVYDSCGTIENLLTGVPIDAPRDMKDYSRKRMSPHSLCPLHQMSGVQWGDPGSMMWESASSARDLPPGIPSSPVADHIPTRDWWFACFRRHRSGGDCDLRCHAGSRTCFSLPSAIVPGETTASGNPPSMPAAPATHTIVRP